MSRIGTDGAVGRLAGFFGVRTLVVAVATVVVGGGLGGCNQRTNEIVEENRALKDRNGVLQQENETLQAANASLQAAVDSRDTTLNEFRAFIEKLKRENANLAASMADFDSRLAGIKFGQLDAATDQALQNLAAQYPDLISYDANRGVVRFSSDLTFASGSDQVTDAGRNSLQALAKILASGPAAAYDVRVVGHTDSQRVRQVPGRSFKDNWELSAFRSISVMREITKMGVVNERVEIAGRGEWMPQVANSASGNTPQNRRVELFLVRGNGTAQARANPSSPAPSPAKASAEDIMK
ncbi:MAG: OmpA family protein [Phycisphaeraceae bacterium]|nr:OmpA family protein [Phycisphaeraceae bacterium]